MTIQWGIIGCGNVTEIKSGPAFQKARDSALVAVMRRDAAKAADYARRHDVAKWYADANALIEDPDVNAVYIATPPGSHLELALKVCAAGKPCYVEKPMARNHDECRHMVEAFRAARLPLFVAYYRRGQERFLKAKQLVADGWLGRLTGVSCRFAEPRHRHVDPHHLPWRLVAGHSGGGLFMDLGCHTLDLLDFMVGPLKYVNGTAYNMASAYDVEDAVSMTFRTRDGAPGTGFWNFAAGTYEDTVELTGTEGRLSFSTFSATPMRLETSKGVETFEIPFPEHVQQPLIQSIVDELNNEGTCPSTGESGARTALAMDKALKSYYGSRADGFWDHPENWPGRRR
jgi:1,5-anhydro-D-fructose reductase (1,5-anhydro-D-mannitol-forming)